MQPEQLVRCLANYRRGYRVRALRNLDADGAAVNAGDIGIVFEEFNAYSDHCGPMVRWFNGGTCNVYQGDVEVF